MRIVVFCTQANIDNFTGLSVGIFSFETMVIVSSWTYSMSFLNVAFSAVSSVPTASSLNSVITLIEDVSDSDGLSTETSWSVAGYNTKPNIK